MDIKKLVLAGLKKNVLIIVLFCIIALFSFISPFFFRVNNLVNIFIQQSFVIMASIGLAFVMIAGGIDLSIGYQISLVGVITTISMMWFNLPIPVAIVLGLITGTSLGFLNGLLSNKLKVHPLIITLGTMTIFQGISFIISKSNPIYNLPDDYKFIGQGFIGPIPLSVIIMVIIAMSAHFILSKTYFGRFVYAVGGNEEAARLAGIPVDRIKLMVFSISSFFVAISAVVLVSRAGSATSLTGVGTEFSAITACILGGVSFKGGSGKIGGVVIGVLILGVLANGMQIIGLGTYPQFVARGIVFLAAIGFDTYQKSIRNSRHKRQPVQTAA
jgi:ribose/xylose/arabinose/galactoside ABC-type transport system permease subunit